MGFRKLAERDSVLNIIKTGKLRVGNKLIDVSDVLEMNAGTEYRRKDINSINIYTRNKHDKVCDIEVLACGSGDVPFLDKYKHDKVCILNFASSKHPGGGFMTGANAQEENLCYHSNLYDCLSKHESFYEFNREHLYKSLYSDGIIFTKDVLFFKQNFKNVLPKLVDVITSAAPNKGAALKSGVKESDIDAKMYERIEQILKVAIDKNVDTLVLGAFGCGVFKNDVKYVAESMRSLLLDVGYGHYFKNVVIPALSKEDRVYKVFNEVFSE